MKKLLIIHQSMEIGGAESSLLGLLQSFDYSKISVDLLLLNKTGELLDLIPKEVHILDAPRQYNNLVLPIREAIKNKSFLIVAARLIGKAVASFGNYNDTTYITKQFCHRFALPFLPKIQKQYDLAISFIDPHYIVGKKITAKKKLAWLHTDFSRIDIRKRTDYNMWDMFDYIVNVSDSCENAFAHTHPELANKSIVIENIISQNYIYSQKGKIDVDSEMPRGNKGINLLSVGRFTEAKNFDNIPLICKKLIVGGHDIKWYIIGYGRDEQLIKSRIAEAQMENHVIMLGKKTNPYPYIKNCDIYVQPSRYEGKCVSVREAQILHKLVIITNYATADSQLIDGYDGVIVPMDNDGCAEGIARVIQDEELQNRLIENTKKNDYTNAREVEKLYRIIDEA